MTTRPAHDPAAPPRPAHDPAAPPSQADPAAAAPAATPARPIRRRRPGAVELFTAALLAGLIARGWLVAHTGSARVQTWLTIFVSIVIQAIPFVVLGTIVSAAIAALVPPSFFARALPRRSALAVPVAGAA